jgi:hypothetical protein
MSVGKTHPDGCACAEAHDRDRGGDRHDAHRKQRYTEQCVQQAGLATLELAEAGHVEAPLDHALSQRLRFPRNPFRAPACLANLARVRRRESAVPGGDLITQPSGAPDPKLSVVTAFCSTLQFPFLPWHHEVSSDRQKGSPTARLPRRSHWPQRKVAVSADSTAIQDAANCTGRFRTKQVTDSHGQVIALTSVCTAVPRSAA